MPKPKQLRFRSEAGEFSAPESKRDLLVKQGAVVLEDKPAANANGEPLPFKPKSSVAAPSEKPSSPEVGGRYGQKATADTEEKV